MKIQAELQPIVDYLKNEKNVTEIFGFDAHFTKEFNCLFWYYNGKVFNIQTNSWYNSKYANDRFDVGLSIVPSHEFGSGVGISTNEMGVSGEFILENIEKYLAFNDYGKYNQYKSLSDHQKFYSFMVKVFMVKVD